MCFEDNFRVPEKMDFQINVRSLVVVTVLTTLVKAHELYSRVENASSATPNKNIIGNVGLNITEKWTWLYPINNTEPDNDTVLWGKVFPHRTPAEPNDEQVNWCKHVGESFEKVNFSNFQVC